MSDDLYGEIKVGPSAVVYATWTYAPKDIDEIRSFFPSTVSEVDGIIKHIETGLKTVQNTRILDWGHKESREHANEVCTTIEKFLELVRDDPTGTLVATLNPKTIDDLRWHLNHFKPPFEPIARRGRQRDPSVHKHHRIVHFLADMFQEQTGTRPTFSNADNLMRNRSDFQRFVEACTKPAGIEIPPDRIGNALKVWRRSRDASRETGAK